ncbi:MAG: hypothetical protein RL684_1805 [Pseudomonadota bacterium]
MRKLATPALTVSLLLAGAGTALADDAKPAAPSLSDVLASSGITATGYVDATYNYVTDSSTDYNTFALNQAALTLAFLPATGFGASTTVIAGTEAFDGGYAPGPYVGGVGGSNTFNVLEAYAQYVGGPLTLKAGKFTTLAGAEVATPNADTNVSRSLLFWYNEPVNHTGVRLAYTAGIATIYGGINDGWNTTTSVTKDKTFEFGVALAPSKTVAVGLYSYYGDTISWGTNEKGKKLLVDLTATFTVTDALTIVASADYDTQENGVVTGKTANWSGVAVYGNYAISDTWRTSLRLEYLDDADGYATGAEQKLKEGTLTLGYMPAKAFEFRVEARYDQSDLTGSKDITQGWLQALYKF